MALTEREHAEMVEAMGFDKGYVHPDHRAKPPVVYIGEQTLTHGEMTVSGDAKQGTMKTQHDNRAA